ncbi:hypothetical protein [uncultured Mediterranean phage]|nr:hypothetical protein [uncultured Mediterranean phage]
MSGPFGSSNFFSGTTVAAAYTIDNSCMLDGTADYLTFTPSGAGDNPDKATISCWVKATTTTSPVVLSAESDVNNRNTMLFNGSKLQNFQIDSSSIDTNKVSTALYRDPTAWYHVIWLWDSTEDAPADRARIFVNGVQITSYSTETNGTQNRDTYIGQDVIHYIGRYSDGLYLDGYLAEFILLDGIVAYPSSFGEFNSDGVWIPVDPSALTFGTNGFWLDFEDSSDLGKDVSGNANDFTSVSMSASNQTLDSPTDSGTTIGNYAVISPIAWRATVNTPTPSNGNLQGNSAGSSGTGGRMLTMPIPSTGKYKWEWTISDSSTAGDWDFGISGANTTASWDTTPNIRAMGAGNIRQNGSEVQSSLTAFSDGDIITVLVNMDDSEIDFKVNDSAFGTTVSFSGTAPDSGAGGWVGGYYMGDSTAGAYVTLNNGQGGFTYTDAGYSALATQNFPAPTITKPTDQFLPILYEGNGAGQRVGDFIPFTDTFAVGASCRFDSGDSDYLTRTPSENGSQTTWTQSLWIKRGILGANFGSIVVGYDDGSNYIWLMATDSADVLICQNVDAGVSEGFKKTTRVFRDTSAWTHLMVVWDTTNVTGGDRQRLYVNGVRVTDLTTDSDPALNEESEINTTSHSHAYNAYNASQFGDGYLAEVVFIDGTALEPSSFGETDTSTGRWIPKDVSGLTFGTNGHYLAFASENNLGDDTSGNGNDFTEYNLDTTNGSNQMYDTPSQNFANLSVGFKGPNLILEEGNLQWDGEASSTSMNEGTFSTMIIPSSGGKFFFEWEVIQPNNNYDPWAGIIPLDGTTFDTSSNFLRTGSGWALNGTGAGASSAITGLRGVHDGTFQAAAIISCTDNDTIGLYLDADNGVFYVNVNGGSLVTVYDGLPVGTAFRFAIQDGGQRQVASGKVNFGQWRYWDSTTLTLDTDAGGYFRYAAIGEYKALQQDNLPANTAGITGFSWIKNRDAADKHILQNRINGIYEYMSSDSNAVQATDTNSVQRFLQQGVQIGNMDEVNTSAESFVLWQWANDGTSAANAIGSITTIATMVNTTAGFSMGQFTGTGSAATIGHGLGVIPQFIIVKSNDRATGNWAVYHQFTASDPETDYLLMDTTDAAADSAGVWNDTAPTSTVFSVGDSVLTNASTKLFTYFCWAKVEGYNSFGSYVGNNDADGPFVCTGFKPAYVLFKNADALQSWDAFDSARSPYNPVDIKLRPNTTNADDIGNHDIDFLANGFKIRGTNASANGDGNTIIYCAFATNPFGGSGVAQARAF